ncbi:glycosyltransferase family 2 protein [Gymnodinialimonas hymeniacidonis]|uniref:glycosyltransferase family 2 protein n=1 Tax=Gymnodinialimonas hymeniacidonis TaxID=3126508 RepID=UPI0034C65E65
MTPADLSVVVVSAGRPEALHRCLLGLSQLRHAGIEVVVVADGAGQQAVQAFAGRIKLLSQDIPNISAARNAGIAAAAGQILAFIDDDAVPEPTWADAVLEAFSDAELAAVTGPVLGRNGISMQWGPIAVNGLGKDLKIDPNQPIRDGYMRKLQGTNMAFRRDVFERLGGFDEAMHFYLDDTDMALRVGRAGLRTAWVAGAVVHHGFQASARRTEDRVPLSLFDIGASTSVFLSKHAEGAEISAVVRDLEAAQSSRLLALAKRKKLNAETMRKLMESLRDGLLDGQERASSTPIPSHASSAFVPFVRVDPPSPTVLSGRPFQRMGLHREAERLVSNGQPVSLFVFEPTPRKHKIQFTNGGWWEQYGGLYGPTDRGEARFQMHSFRGRLDREVRRISATRGLLPDGDTN